MEKVKKLIRAGSTLVGAVRESLRPRTLATVAATHGLRRSDLNGALTGRRTVSERELAALVAELGGTPDEWRVLFAETAHKRALNGVAA